MKKTKRSFRWAFGYIFIRLIFFTWVVIAIFWWYNTSWTELWIMTLWISIAILALIIMVILHIIIFRMSDKTREKWLKILKRIWKIIWIILLVGIILLILNIIYGKIQYSKIPEVEESMFYRTEHQTKLPDDEDALIQLQKAWESYTNFNGSLHKNELWKNLGDIYKVYNWQTWWKFDTPNPYKDNQIWWERHQDECILVYSWDEESCGTWVYNKETLDRIFNSHFDKITENWESVNLTIKEYLDKKELELKTDLQELNKLISMDYYLPSDQQISLRPRSLWNYHCGLSVSLLYYTQKEDWEMVKYIVETNNKITDLYNNLWWTINILNTTANQTLIDRTLNSIIKLLPEETRIDIANLYEKNMPNRENLISNLVKWEFALYNEEIKFIEYEENWFMHFFPLYSKKDTKRIALYAYKLLFNEDTETYNSIFQFPIYSNKWYIKWNITWLWKSLYNIYGKSFVLNIIPRPDFIYKRIDQSIFQKQALITNLKSWEYKIRFNEKERTDNPSNYEYYKISTEE